MKEEKIKTVRGGKEIPLTEKREPNGQPYTRILRAYTTNDTENAMGKSMHLSLDGEELNFGMGVLYAEADMSDGAAGKTKVLDSPWIFRQGAGFGAIAVILDIDMAADSHAGSLGYWESSNLYEYDYKGLIKLSDEALSDVAVRTENGKYIISYTKGGARFERETADFATFGEERASDTEVGECIMMLSDTEADRLVRKLGITENTGVQNVELNVKVGQRLEIDDMPMMTSLYSDGGTDTIPVKWNESDFNRIDFDKVGIYTVRGSAELYEPTFPMIDGRPDPDIYQYQGKYYFIATNEYGQTQLGIRSAETIEGLKDAPETVLLSGKTLWAPELHEIGGELYMLYASGSDWNRVQCHMMKCEGDPADLNSWGEPIRVMKKDGSYLCEDGITLDMTYFEGGERSYLMWAQRRIDYSGSNHGSSDIYIGSVDPLEPTKLASEPVLIIQPVYSWDRYSATVDEGPFAIKHDGKIFITYSGSATDDSYALGLLSADENDDLLDVRSWKRSNYPRLASAHVPGELGPGHNSFVKNEYGKDMLVYHAKLNGGIRSAGVRNVYWSSDGEPILYMTPERYLKQEYRNVTAAVIVTRNGGTDEAKEENTAYLFAYFTGNDPSEERLFYGVSRDGYNFKALNGGQSVMTSRLGTNCMRDPFIFKGEDGYYYITATDMRSSSGWSGDHTTVVYKTPDLIHITDSALIDYRRFKGFEGCSRAWAPQVIWCEEKNAYMVYLTILNPGDKYGTVMYRHYAKDLCDQSTYTVPELMLDEPEGENSCAIDGDIIYDKFHNKYIMYYCGKQIASADTLSGQWIHEKTKYSDGQLPMKTESGVPMAVEGSNIWQITGKDKWVIAADGTPFNGGCYALLETTDFETYRQLWPGKGDYSFDFTPRHGYVIPISERELNNLFKEYGSVDFCKEDSALYRLNINACEKKTDVAEDMFGIFFEDINYGADGGLYAEVVENRSFEAAHCNPDKGEEYIKIPANAWTWENAEVNFMSENPLNSNNTTYARVTARDGASLTNECYSGFAVKKGESFTASLFARGDYKGKVTISIIDGREILGSVTFDNIGRDFAKYTGVITSAGSTSSAKVKVTFTKGTVDVDMISVMTKNTFNGRENGLRKDIAEMLSALHPKFMRFPGGCVIEGYYLDNRYKWKESVGPVHMRRENWNRWQTGANAYDYCQTMGLGYYEYFLFCEDIGAKALPVVSCGIGCQYQSGEASGWDDLYNVYIKDALDLIEFANGIPDETWKEMIPDITDPEKFNSNWANLRALMGHPESFNMEYLGIGNEQWNTRENRFFERYEAFEEEIHKFYPKIKLISTSGPLSDGTDFDSAWSWLKTHNGQDNFTYAVDEHYYKPPEWFLSNVNRYDTYDRGGFSVFAGEYAANGDYGNTLWSALAEAAYLTGLEKNSDIVKLASYAPLLARTGANQWEPNMIWFNGESVYAAPNYYVQSMYANNMGAYTIESELSVKNTDHSIDAETRNTPLVNSEGPVYSSASVDPKYGDIILKLVNTAERRTDLRINIDGAENIMEKAEEYVLTGSSKEAANSHAIPENVVTSRGCFYGASKSFTYTMEGLSFTVLRLHTRKPDLFLNKCIVF